MGERLKSLNRSKGQALGDQRQVEMHFRFLEAMLASLGSAETCSEDVECPACLLDVDSRRATILPCGHRLHLSCAEEAVRAQGCCPQCRKATVIQMFTNVEEHFKQQESPEAPLRRRYGSKLAQVIETIQRIQRVEGDSAKCIVFLQWDAVAAQLERGLQAIGITPLTLRGHLMHRQKVIARFVDSVEPDASVLLLSLEQSPTGMNLTCAHHVLLVHPMHAERPEDAVSHELQAIGRVRRQGQTRRVHVYRFVARGTVEEPLARMHHAACAKEHPALEASRCKAPAAHPATPSSSCAGNVVAGAGFVGRHA